MIDNRNPVPDLLKGIAVIAMIQVHVMELFAKPEILSSVIGKISLFIGGPFAAPVFLTVMGYFLGASLKSKKQKIKRGVYLIFLGLILNAGLNAHLLIKIINGTFNLNPLEYIFGADILFSAGLSIIIIALSDNLFKRSPYAAIGIAILIPLITPYIPDLPTEMRYFQAFIYGGYTWSYFPVFPWMAYSLLGFGIYRIFAGRPALFNNITRKAGLIIILSVLIISMLFIPAFRQITRLQEYYHHGIFLFVWISIFLAFYSLIIISAHENFKGIKLFSFLKWLGKNVTLIYIIQWLIIGNIATAIYKTQELVVVIIWIPAIIFISSVLGYLIILLRLRLAREKAGQ